MRFQFALASSLLLASSALAQVQPLGQCGGKAYTGDTTCVAGYSCVVVSDWYSQCKNTPTTTAPPVPTRSPDPTTSVNPSQKLTINPDTKYQTIDGFGGMNLGNNWDNAPALSTGVINTAYSELGLSIMRVRIPVNRNDWSRLVSSIKEGLKFPEVKVLASIWSPPANLKSNNNLVGGNIPSSRFQQYVDYLQSFIDFMKENGIELYAIAVQNEPDIRVSYESCDWSVGELRNFFRDHAGKINGPKVATAEAFQFNHGMYDSILNDPSAEANVDIVAGHIYGGGLAAYPLATQKGKPIWMTEHLMNDNVGWGETMQIAREINNCMNVGWSAYIYWYIQRYYSFIGDGQNGTPSGQVLPRGWVFSHYSKYIRPGYVRIGASGTNSVSSSAFVGPDGKMVVVMVNSGNPVTLGLDFGKSVSIDISLYTSQSSGKPTKMPAALNGRTVVVDIPGNCISTVVVV